MTTLPDLLYVALFAVVLPLLDYAVFWPTFRRRSEADPVRARRWLWTWAILGGWPVVAAGAVLWEANDRSWASFGFSVPDGWRLWTSTALFLLVATYFAYTVAVLARNADLRASVRQQFGALGAVLPHTRADLYWFGAVSLTAGFCEEFLFRGYFIWALAPWFGWWGAAVLSVLLFGTWHLYQGFGGAIRTAIIGAIFTLLVATFNSLWPAIAVHALFDLGQGMIAWLALREEQPTGDMMEAKEPTETLSA
ncbi:MAG TPA: CPBP family intramembrane glutamic endopeptidase [Gemmatimonadaceae bacterium]